jgi:hypothetical protein
MPSEEDTVVDSSNAPLRARLEALAAYVPVFEDPDFEFAAMQGGNQLQDGAIQMPFCSFSEQASRFVRATYEHEWIVTGFDWSTWAGTPEASALYEAPSALASASPEQLARLLTRLVRQDRFSDGTLARAYTDGLLTRIVRRVARLLQELESVAQTMDDVVDASEAFYQEEIHIR